MKYHVILIVALCFGYAAAKCKFRRGGEWSACSPACLKTRTDVLKRERSDAECQPIRNISKACDGDCNFGPRRLASWGECDQLSSTVTCTRQLVSGEGCPDQLVEVLDCGVQRRLDRKAARKSEKAQRRAQRRRNRQQNKEQRRLQRKQRRQQRRQNRQNAQNAN